MGKHMKETSWALTQQEWDLASFCTLLPTVWRCQVQNPGAVTVMQLRGGCLRRDQTMRLLPHTRAGQRLAVSSPLPSTVWGHTKTHARCHALALYYPTSKTVRAQFLFFINCPASVILWWHQKWADNWTGKILSFTMPRVVENLENTI